MIEICCGSFEDALNAYLGGAKRIELNSALHLGGLTPSLGSLILTKKQTDLEVICMVRPRGAGFCYTETEFLQMLEDAEILLANGSDGIAFGFLTESGLVDIEKTKQMVKLIKSYNKIAVFHRAFDCVVDAYKALDILIELKIDRVLTSGLQATAIDGEKKLMKLQKQYGKQIEILPGSGINASNAANLMKNTNIKQIHSSCKTWKKDNTTSNCFVSFNYANENNIDCYDIVSKELVEKLIGSVKIK